VVMMMPWLQVKKQRKAAGDRKVKEQGTDWSWFMGDELLEKQVNDGGVGDPRWKEMKKELVSGIQGWKGSHGKVGWWWWNPRCWQGCKNKTETK
jgi:hypothetical protein